LRAIYTNRDIEDKIDFISRKDGNLNLSEIFSKAIIELYDTYNSDKEVRLKNELEIAKRKFEDAQKNFEDKKYALDSYYQRKKQEEINTELAIKNKEQERLDKKKSNFRDLIQNRDKTNLIKESELDSWINEFVNSNLLLGDFLKCKGYEIRDYQLCKIGGKNVLE
jgi:hypothetical protein